MKNSVQIGDEIRWQGQTRRVVEVLSINVALDGVDEVICLPVDATRADVFNSTRTSQ